MKAFKLFRFLSIGFVVLIAITFLSSCSDDDPAPNQIVVDGRGLKLDKGYIEDNGTEIDDDGVEGRVYTVYLFGPGLDFDANENPVGVGDAVVLDIFSPSTDELEDGTYVVSDDEVVGIFISEIYENYIADDDDADVEYQSNSGSVSIKKSGANYTFKFDYRVFFENSDGDPDAADVRGQFSGPLTPYDD